MVRKLLKVRAQKKQRNTICILLASIHCLAPNGSFTKKWAWVWNMAWISFINTQNYRHTTISTIRTNTGQELPKAGSSSGMMSCLVFPYILTDFNRYVSNRTEVWSYYLKKHIIGENLYPEGQKKIPTKKGRDLNQFLFLQLRMLSFELLRDMRMQTTQFFAVFSAVFGNHGMQLGINCLDVMLLDVLYKLF